MFEPRSSSTVLLAIAALLAAAATAAAQSTQEATAAANTSAAVPADRPFVGATLETYYQFNWNRVPDRTIPLRAYDTRANMVSLQQVGLVLDAPPDVGSQRRYGGRLDLQFGQATETVQGSQANEPRPEVYRHVWQACGSYVFPLGPSELGVRYQERDMVMLDLAFVAVTLLFFIVAAAYVSGCERIK